MRQRDHVGKVILLLRVVVAEPIEPGAQARGGQHHDAGVDFGDGAFSRGSVLLLDDAHQAPRRIAHDAAITGGILEFNCQDSQSRSGHGDQSLQRLDARERHIAVQDERLRGSLEMGQRLHDGVTGTELRRLPRPGHGDVRW